MDKRIIEISRTYAYFAAPRLAFGRVTFVQSREEWHPLADGGQELAPPVDDQSPLVELSATVEDWIQSPHVSLFLVDRTRSGLTRYSSKRLFALSRVTFGLELPEGQMTHVLRHTRIT